jgi:hypothetical protein
VSLRQLVWPLVLGWWLGGGTSAFADDVSSKRAAAERHFKIGLELVQRRAMDSALAEFLRSRELFPTAGALLNAAVCLRDLGRNDEALEMYSELLDGFRANLSGADHAAVESDVARLSEQTGELVVQSEPTGARVAVDGRDRGAAPSAKPIRVTVGKHAIRVFSEGWAPFEAEVEVGPKQVRTVVAKLAVVARVGALEVDEANGRVFEVVIDGESVGITPWRGRLAEGEHRVALRGPGDSGAPARAVRIDVGATAQVTLTGATLPSELRIEPLPSNARVAIDGREVARGSWTGWLPSGDHTMALSAGWHEASTFQVRTSSRAPTVVRPELEPVRRLYAEILGGIAWADTRSVLRDCGGGCVNNVGGGRVGWLIAPRFGVEAFYLGTGSFNYRTSGSVVAQYLGAPFVSHAFLQDASLGADFYGLSAGYRFFDSTPLTLRAMAGAASVTASSSGRGFFGTNYVTQSASDTYLSPMIGPEVRIGYRLGRTVAVDAGVAAVFFLLHDESRGVGTIASYVARFGGEDVYFSPPQSFGAGLGWMLPASVAVHLDIR